MKKRRLGNIGLELSPVVLGSTYFGTAVSKEDAFLQMDTYRAHGGNVLDTAPSYGIGASEQVIGEYLKSRQCRQEIVISSKAGHPHFEDFHKGRLSHAEIEADIDMGLLRLGVSHIDILWLHRDDPNRSVEEILDTLCAMVKKGKILEFGFSNWSFERIAAANAYATAHQMPTCVASQIQWSLAECVRMQDDTLVMMDSRQERFYQETGMPVFAFSSQAKGFFEKYHQNSLAGKAKERYLAEENVMRYQRLLEISQETGLSLSALSLAYLLAEETFDVYPIIGASRPEQLADSMQILTEEIPEKIRRWRSEDGAICR